jgi:hypothetical protein
MGAVAAYDGAITVTTRGHRLPLSVDSVTGKTSVTSDTLVPLVDGTEVEITLPWNSANPAKAAGTAIRIAESGEGVVYSGPSHPSWYAPADLHRLLANVRPETTRVDALVRDVFGINLHDPRIAQNLDQEGAAALYGDLCRLAGKPPAELGCIGPMQRPHYARIEDHALINGARIPFTAEAWVTAEGAEARGEGSVAVTLLLNRSPCLAALVHGNSHSSGLSISGSELRCRAQGAKTADYDISISVIAPYVQLTSDGKSPALAVFNEAIGKAVSKATTAAYRAIARPPKKMSIKDSAWEVMEWAYLKASANPGRSPPHLPANARQIMYAARPKILALTGAEKFVDSYFTQNLLPDFVEANPRLCADWDVVFDARGHFREPHTGRTVPLGTIDMRSYLGERPHLGPSVTLNANDRYPTSGPANRYRNILFIEKEGFGPLLRAAQIAQRSDIAIMSTKGMSVTASRMLLDRRRRSIGCSSYTTLTLPGSASSEPSPRMGGATSTITESTWSTWACASPTSRLWRSNPNQLRLVTVPHAPRGSRPCAATARIRTRSSS